MIKTALITGASSGIGLSLARRLLEVSVEVTGIARNFSKTDCNGIKKIELDLSELDTLPDSLSVFTQAPDALILNAGYGRFGGLEQMSHRQIRHLIDSNLVSNLFLIKHFLPLMKARKHGDIVLIGSESALHGGRMGTLYSASKFAVRGLAQSLRLDCSNSGIRVILVNPGAVESPFYDDLAFEPASGEEFSLQPDDVACAIHDALKQPRNVVLEEINMQAMKRSYSKKAR